jgi:hypothetical protein
MIKDKSGNGNDGTIFGATWAQGKRGSALSYDGTDDYVNCGNNSNLNISGAFTAEAWIKTTDSSAGVIISKGHYVPDNEFQFYTIL